MKESLFQNDCLFLKQLKQLNINIRDYKLVTCQENGIRELEENEDEIFYFWLHKITDSMKGELVFRGQNKKDLIKLLDKDYNSLTNKDKAYHIEHYLFHRLFFFGEKARCFYTDTIPHDFLRPSKGGCTLLFYEIKEKLSSPSERLKPFVAQNQGLFSFFMDDANIKHFCRVLQSHEEIYWFYCILLHRLGKAASIPSQYISNSKDIIISDTFSTSNRSKPPILIVYVIPIKQLGRLYSAVDINSSLSATNESLIKHELPTLFCWPYEEQQEITIAGCLFPHYMWFVIDKKAKRIVVNPHMLTDENKNSLNLHIEIDQKDFCERLRRETSYTCGISYDCYSGKEEIIT